MNKVGLVLSGGGARGFAHVGIIKMFDELGVKPFCVSGCSMGAIIGALYCLGYSGREIEDKIKSIGLRELFRVSMSKVSNGSRIENYFNELFENKNFEDLKIPLYVNAIDLDSGEEIIFDKGNIARAVRASMSIPGLFKPIVINNRILVDGGTKNNIPLQVLLDQGLDKIVSINVGGDRDSESILEMVGKGKEQRIIPKFSKIMARTLTIMQSNEHMIRYSREKSDLFITPELRDYNLVDFMKYNEIIKIGEDVAEKYRRDINRIFKYGKVRSFLGRNVSSRKD